MTIHSDADYAAGGPARKSGSISVAELDQLRIELRDQAADLDRRRRHEASDLATIIACRLDELIERAV